MGKQKGKKKSKKNAQNKSTNENKQIKNVDKRWERMYYDPKFLPVDGRIKVDEDVAHLVEDSFEIPNHDIASKLRQNADIYMKKTLKDVYKIDKKKSKKKEEIEEKIEETPEVDEETREIDEEKEESLLPKESMTFDEFLEKIKDRPELQSDNDLDGEDETGAWEIEGLDSDEERELSKPDAWEQLLDVDAPRINDGEETRRLAVMNFDWTIINSEDLYVLFKSMCPTFGNVESVTIYLSDFGAKKLEEEQRSGPSNVFRTKEEIEEAKRIRSAIEKRKEESKKERFKQKKERFKIKKRVDDEYEEEGNIGLHPDRVREYEINKLKYYFAVVVCDSVQTAIKLYEECDGQEFENSSIKLDLRFIPDDISFEGRKQLNSCNKMPINYHPKKNLYAKQLQSTETILTWDADEPERQVLKRGDFTGLTEAYLNKFLASSDSESDSEDENDDEEEISKEESTQDDQTNQTDKTDQTNETEKKVEKKTKKSTKKKTEKSKKKKLLKEKKKKKYAALVKLAQLSESSNRKFIEEDKEMEMEVEIDLEAEKKGQELVKKVQQKQLKEKEGWWSALEQKRKEKLKERRKELKALRKQQQEETEEERKKREQKLEKQLSLMMDDNDKTEEMEYSVKYDRDKERKRKKSKSQENISKDDNFEFYVNDERIKNLFMDADFELDPTHPKFRESHTTQKIREMKKGVKRKIENVENESTKGLVERIKQKTKKMKTSK